MQLTEWLTTIGPAIAYYPKLGKIFGVKEAVLLCQLIWWRSKYNTEDGWFYKSRDEILEATGLSMDEQDGACKRLKKAGVLETHYHRLSHRKFYLLNEERINKLWQQNHQQTRMKSPNRKIQFRETGKSSLGKPENPVSRSGKIQFRETFKSGFDNKRLKKENNKDKTTRAQQNAVSQALHLLGFAPDDKKSFVCLLNLHNQYSDPELWESNVEYTASQKPDNPIAYLTQSLKQDYGRVLRDTPQAEKNLISLPPPGSEIIFNDQTFLVDEGHFVHNANGHVVLTPGSLRQGLEQGTVTVKV